MQHFLHGGERNFYPRPPRGGRPAGLFADLLAVRISIHALREEGDLQQTHRRLDFPRFLSTPSARRATPRAKTKQPRRHYFYPRPPRGGRRQADNRHQIQRRFLSTPSARRATGNPLQPVHRQGISIHALREEGDGLFTSWAIPSVDFYPRPPRGGRQVKDAKKHTDSLFLSTPSARRATQHRSGQAPAEEISIHALREEGDFRIAHLYHTASVISIHALREEGDQSCTLNLPCHENFYPRPPRGGRRGRSGC